MGVPLEDPSLCQLLRKRYTLEGSLDRHHFDVVVGNGIPYFAAQALSFEFPDLTTLKKTMDATAWTVADVLEQTQQDGDSLRAVDVSPLDPDLLDATVRLARLLENRTNTGRSAHW